ncbi:hypothetical protein GGTG_00249 [Gaeumannomyces tritici R3-111a-1]|uniref:Uncharacterized protein n=1 Tax=Gaeumannomyces tritici (strain R3-111a-1) TaxID=644352 RepID=J3NG56_GAET3|nr:hypothetical protein GGTG_00249 [Gaeumannomyces tritici R3-111a-1]EJT80246.1 hypothetical protein GGTG_00249 [Gaeumannomyces tritici R3-111a-1]
MSFAPHAHRLIWPTARRAQEHLRKTDGFLPARSPSMARSEKETHASLASRLRSLRFCCDWALRVSAKS